MGTWVSENEHFRKQIYEKSAVSIWWIFKYRSKKKMYCRRDRDRWAHIHSLKMPIKWSVFAMQQNKRISVSFISTSLKSIDINRMHSTNAFGLRVASQCHSMPWKKNTTNENNRIPSANRSNRLQANAALLDKNDKTHSTQHTRNAHRPNTES